MISAAWIDGMRRASVLDVAARLGYACAPPRGSCAGVVYRCPACGAQRERHGERDVYRGATGVGMHPSGHGWRCFACDASGDAIDFAALALGGKRYHDASKTARHGVRAWCLDFLGLDGAAAGDSGGTRPTPAASTPAPAPASPIAPPTRPPQDHLAYLWQRAAGRVDQCTLTADYLRSREIDPTVVADLDLARALRDDVRLPPFARAGRRGWVASGHRLIVPLYDEAGRAMSVLARRTIAIATSPKSLSPDGSHASATYARAGLVMCCSVARRMLRGDAPADLRLVIAEGEIDYLSWVTQLRSRDGDPVAVLAIVQGSWTQEIADRIPGRTRVTIATDLDRSGDHYADRIAPTLRGRDLIVRRWGPTSASTSEPIHAPAPAQQAEWLPAQIERELRDWPAIDDRTIGGAA